MGAALIGVLRTTNGGAGWATFGSGGNFRRFRSVLWRRAAGC